MELVCKRNLDPKKNDKPGFIYLLIIWKYQSIFLS